MPHDFGTATGVDPVLSELIDELEQQLHDGILREGGLHGGAWKLLLERRRKALQSWGVGAERLGVVWASREMQMDRTRRRTALQAEHAALVGHARRRLADSEHVLGRPPRLRAVLAHRGDWFREKVAAALSRAGVVVVSEVADGAEAVGVIVAEQPELALVEELLPSYGGREIVYRLRRGAPHTRLAVQVAHNSTLGQFADADAAAVFTRQLTPDQVADQLLQRTRALR